MRVLIYVFAADSVIFIDRGFYEPKSAAVNFYLLATNMQLRLAINVAKPEMVTATDTTLQIDVLKSSVRSVIAKALGKNLNLSI